MEIEKCSRPTKCDFAGCNNLATYCFSTKGLIKRELAFCEDRLKEMYREMSKLQIPKPAEAPFKLKPRIKKEQ